MKRLFLAQTLLGAAATSTLLPSSIEASPWTSKHKGAATHGNNKKGRAPLPLPHSLALGDRTTGGKQHPVTSSSALPRIIGGEPVESGFEWFADWHGCGGALIWSDIVVTAAHCGSFGDDQVYLNAIESPNERRSLEEEGPEQRTVVARRAHPYWDPYNVANDIMILKLDVASTIEPLALNDDPALPVDGEPLTVIGHGVTDPDNFSGSETLQQATIPAASMSQCADEYADFFIPIDREAQLCAGGEGERGACFGDSGGPVMMQDSATGEYTLAGIVSFGINCAELGVPDVNTRVSTYNDWIDQQICELSSNPPSNCPAVQDDILPVRIDVQLDSFGDEAIWSVSQNNTNLFRAQGFYDPDDFAPLVSDLLLLAPGDYEFTIIDLFGDGLSQGTITILLETEIGDDVVLAESYGDYTVRRQFMFTVPTGVSNTAPPIETNPPVGDCEDTDEPFVVSDAVGARDCAWLSVNLERFGWLCQFVDVASACPLTCQVCHLFDDAEV